MSVVRAGPLRKDVLALGLVTPPIRVPREYGEARRYMQARRWVLDKCPVDVNDMSDVERKVYNRLVRFPTPHVDHVADLLTFADNTGSLSTNSIVWLQGPAGAGKTSVALEAAAAFTDPDSVGGPPPTSSTRLEYAHIPIAYMAGQNSFSAGLLNTGCAWFGHDRKRTGTESALVLAKAVDNCRTRVVIIDDLQSVKGADSSVGDLRHLLLKLSAHIILVSLPPQGISSSSVVRDLMSGSEVGDQLRARTRFHRLPAAKHHSFDDYAQSLRLFMGRFKLKDGNSDDESIIEFLYSKSRTHHRLSTLPLAYTVLTGVAAAAVGTAESVTLSAVMAAVHD